MKRFFSILSIFCLIFLAFAIGADYMITSGLHQSDNRKYAVWNDIYFANIDADVLILGSSRAWCSYNTYIIDSILGCNSYNLGIDGHTLEYQILRYNTYCRFHQRPHMVILNVDFYSTLGTTSDAQYEREQFFPYILDDSLTSAVATQKHITLLDRYIPLYRYIGYREEFETGVLSFWGRTHGTDGGLYKGYRGNDWEWSAPNDKVSNHQIGDVDASMLDTFVAALVASRVDVVLVKGPFHDWMFEHYQGIENIDSIFLEIATKYDCLLLDYYHYSLSHDTHYFYNPSHLNKRGADLFTTQMCNDILTASK